MASTTFPRGRRSRAPPCCADPEAQRSLHASARSPGGRDYQEVVNYSFVEPAWEADFAGSVDPIRLLNPIASQLAVMRSTLIPGLVANVRYNVNRPQTRVRVFEIGRVFLRRPDAAEARWKSRGFASRCGWRRLRVAWTRRSSGAPRRALRISSTSKAIWKRWCAPQRARFEAAVHPALHPGRAARVWIGDAAIGWIGELHPKWQQKYELPGPPVLFEVDAATLRSVPMPAYERCRRFPPVRRDLAVIFDERCPMQPILDDLAAHKPPQVREVRYSTCTVGKGIENGKKSLAFRVLLQDTQKTLTDAEVESAMAQSSRGWNSNSAASCANEGGA